MKNHRIKKGSLVVLILSLAFPYSAFASAPSVLSHPDTQNMHIQEYLEQADSQTQHDRMIQFQEDSKPTYIPEVDYSGEISRSHVHKQRGSDKELNLSTINNRRIIIKVKEGVSWDEHTYSVRIAEKTDYLQDQMYILTVPEQVDYQQLLMELRQDSRVLYAEPDYLHEISFRPTDPIYDYQWYLEKIQMPRAWDVTQGSSDVTIAVLDTGVNVNHPDLAGRVLPGYDFVNDDDDASDDNGHGTHIAGMIASNANQIGVTGIDFNAKILPLKIADEEGTISSTDAIEGIKYAIEHDVDVINMSYVSYQYNEAVVEVLQQASDQGIVLVAAAGNDAENSWSYPAAYSPVIGVSATDEQDNPAYFTNYGSFIDVAAPGETIYSTYYKGGYGSGDGTSFAAPIVSGLAGLLKGLHPDWSPPQITWAIEYGTDSVGETEWSPMTGYGRVNAYKVLTAQLPSLENDAPNTKQEAMQLDSEMQQGNMVTVQQSIEQPMDVDWYSFEMSANEQVTIKLSDLPEHLDLVGDVIFEGDGMTNRFQFDESEMGIDEEFSLEAKPGTYYLAVYDLFNHWSQSPYRMEVMIGSVEENEQDNVDENPIVEQQPIIFDPPTANVPSGDFSEAFDLELTTTVPDATIIYTLDGSTPTSEHGLVYSEPVTIPKQTTEVKVIAVHGDRSSDVRTFTYTYVPKVIFPDTVDHWAREYITFLAQKELINGYPNGNFGPDHTIKRAEAAIILVKELGIKLEQSSFKDAKDHWASKYIGAATNAGIFTGYGNEQFRPDQPLTREEMATIIVNTYDLTGTSNTSFSDVNDDGWSNKYIQTLVANKIVSGYPDGTFRPEKAILRSEFATILAKVLKGEEGENVPEVLPLDQ